MNDKKTSQSHNEDNDSPWSSFLGGNWQPMVDAQLARMNVFYDEFDRLVSDGTGHAQMAVDEMARFTKQSLNYGTQLAQAWRKVAVEATQRSASMMQHKSE